MLQSEVAMLIRFLEQNNGSFSKKKKKKEFKELTTQEMNRIEQKYGDIFEKQ